MISSCPRDLFGLVCLGLVTASMAFADDNKAGLNLTLPLPALLEKPDQTATTEVVLYDYLIIRQDAQAVFETLARDLKLRLDLSDRVHGTLSNLRLTGTRDEVLDTAASQMGLDWFSFNGVLYVSDRAEALTRLVRLGDLKPDKVMTVLQKSGLTTERVDIEPAADGTALALSGPPKFLALAEAMIEGIPPVPAERVAEAAARIVTIRRANETEKVQLP